VLYEGPVRRLLHRLKFENLALAAGPLADLAVEALRRDPSGLAGGAEVVVPVPVHWIRRNRRGFNQSELIARRIARALGLPLVAALRKVRATEPQVELERERRLANPRGAFRARRAAAIRGRPVLLVDDVMTTASTAAECSRALLEAGAREVFAFAVARQAYE
jgi:ComF family protein